MKSTGREDDPQWGHSAGTTKRKETEREKKNDNKNQSKEGKWRNSSPAFIHPSIHPSVLDSFPSRPISGDIFRWVQVGTQSGGMGFTGRCVSV